MQINGLLLPDQISLKQGSKCCINRGVYHEYLVQSRYSEDLATRMIIGHHEHERRPSRFGLLAEEDYVTAHFRVHRCLSQVDNQDTVRGKLMGEPPKKRGHP